MVRNETQTRISVGGNGRLSQRRLPALSPCADPSLLLLNVLLSETRCLPFRLYCIFVFSAYFHKSNKWTVTLRGWLFLALPSEVAVMLFDKPTGMCS